MKVSERKQMGVPLKELSPSNRISKISTIKKYSNQKNAFKLLYDAAMMIAIILNEENLKIGHLCEMYPKSPNLLGLNVNRGQKILLRLRYSYDVDSFLPLGDLVGTLLHEITHNLHGNHNKDFYNYLNKITSKLEQLQSGKIFAKSFYEEQRLGNSSNYMYSNMSIRDKRLSILGKGKFKSEARRLGTLSGNPDPIKASTSGRGNLRNLMLVAAERRLQDSKWCSSESKKTPASHIPMNDELTSHEDVEILDFKDKYPHKQNSKFSNFEESLEVIDLTKEEYSSDEFSDTEAIIIDACQDGVRKHKKGSISSSDTFSDRDSLRSFGSNETAITKSEVLLNDVPFNTSINYISSSPGRTFFHESYNDSLPRRKLVADLDFQDIIDKESKVGPQRQDSILYNEIKDFGVSTPETHQKNEENFASEEVPVVDTFSNELHNVAEIQKKRSSSSIKKSKPKKKKNQKSVSHQGKSISNKSAVKERKKVVKDIKFSDLLGL